MPERITEILNFHIAKYQPDAHATQMKTVIILKKQENLGGGMNCGTNYMENKCETCKYHDDFSWVCVNGLSENRADFTDENDWCDKWEERKGGE